MVVKPDGTIFEFKQSSGGLYYLNTTQEQKPACPLVNMVADNHSKYTNPDYLHALATHKLQAKIDYPSTCDYITIVMNNMLPNCPII